MKLINIKEEKRIFTVIGETTKVVHGQVTTNKINQELQFINNGSYWYLNNPSANLYEFEIKAILEIFTKLNKGKK